MVLNLNIDGSARGAEVTSGGILQNAVGNFAADFSSYYGEGSNNLAEFLVVECVVCTQYMHSYT